MSNNKTTNSGSRAATTKPDDAANEQPATPTLSQRLAAVVPKTAGPAGDVTLDDTAGALAPWLAHRTLAEVAKDIAEKIRDCKGPDGAQLLVPTPRPPASAAAATDPPSGDTGNVETGSPPPPPPHPPAAAEPHYESALTGAPVGGPPATHDALSQPGHDEATEVDAEVIDHATRQQAVPEESKTAVEEMPDGAEATTGAPARADQATAPSLEPDPETTAHQEPLILLVDDLELLSGDWTARLLEARITGLKDKLDDLNRHVAAATPMSRFHIQAHLFRELAAEQVAAGTDDETKSEESEGAAAGEDEGAEEAPAHAGPMEGALNLLSLLRTDYTISGRAVEPGAAEAKMLVAGHLASHGLNVQLDSFRTLKSNKLLDFFADLVRARDDLTRAAAILKGRIAPAEAELAATTARIARLDPLWAGALTDKEADHDAAAGILEEIKQLEAAAERLETPTGRGRALVDYLDGVLTTLNFELSAWINAPAEGVDPPLLIATSRYDLSGDGPGATHVLYVSVDHLGADIVTRKTVLGDSGRLGHLGAANASWLLLDVKANRISGGGNQYQAMQMTYDLTSGENATAEVTDGATLSDDQTLAKLRPWIITAVVMLVIWSLIVTTFGVLGLVN